MMRGRQPALASAWHDATAGDRAVGAFLVFVAALVVSGCGGDGTNESARDATATGKAGAVAFPLREENQSGASGEATLQPSEGGASGPGRASGDGTRVAIRLSTDTGASHPAHIHNVTCAAYRGMSSFGARLETVQDSLNAVARRVSTTVVSVELGARTNGHYSVNVHEPAYPYDVIACGDIPRR
jgi:FtsP/CotA-like multicopper oxidase with cupredoxin domain